MTILTRTLAAALFSVCALPTFAGVPYNVDDPATLEPHRAQIALGYGSSKVEGAEAESAGISLAYGATNSLELDLAGLGVTSVRTTGADRQSGLGDITAGVRWRFLEETKTRPQVGLAYVWKIPTADPAKGLGTGVADHTVYAMAAKSFGKWYLFGNVGGLFPGAAGAQKACFYGAGLTYQATEKIAIGFDLYGNRPTASGARPEAAWGVGITDNIAPDHTLLLAVGKSERGYSDLNVFAAYAVTFGKAGK